MSDPGAAEYGDGGKLMLVRFLTLDLSHTFLRPSRPHSWG